MTESKDFLKIFLVKGYCYYELASQQLKITEGELGTIKDVADILKEGFSDFREPIFEYDWMLISMHNNALVLEYAAIDFLRGATFAELGVAA